MGGATLPQILQAQQQSGRRLSHKAVIMIFLPGGPAHQDMFDLKPDAPIEIRGEFKPISTNVPGLQICEHLPRLARLADKYTIIRSIAHEFAEDRLPAHYRPVTVVDAGARKSIALRIEVPVEDMARLTTAEFD